ncbi:MAG: homocysteine S-methyltransferase family protein [Candidatus Puniceispirillaceae bacterium]
MSQIAFLDGGLGQEINNRSSQANSHPLWSVQVMFDEPDIVVAAHKDFIAAGARVITTNNYTATLPRLTRHGYAEQFDAAHHLAFDLLNRAIDESADALQREIDVNIAGCLPPIAASYVAEAALNYQDSYDQYTRLIDIQADHVDVFLVETISNITEARAAAAALKDAGQKRFIGLTLADDLSNSLRSGETLEAAIDVLGGDGVDAICVNCSFPEAIDAALPILNASGLRFGGYANGFTSIAGLAPGTTVDNLAARQDLSPAAYAGHAIGWAKAGATLIGGCCEISPDHIAYLHQSLCDAGYKPAKLI